MNLILIVKLTKIIITIKCHYQSLFKIKKVKGGKTMTNMLSMDGILLGFNINSGSAGGRGVLRPVKS